MTVETTDKRHLPGAKAKSHTLGRLLKLESGHMLGPVDVAYETYGKLNADGTNAVLLCHALTGDAHAGGGGGWWMDVIGPGKPFDTNRYFVLCSNILGSCYGTTGPTSLNPNTGRPYGPLFPQITIRDMVHVQRRLLAYLGVNFLRTVAGGSLGGMQVLEWAVCYPEMVGSIIPIATAARHSAWCIGLNEAARLAITSDPSFLGGHYIDQPAQGLALARIIAMISYRSQTSFEDRFGRTRVKKNARVKQHTLFRDTDPGFEVESYLRYQGEKLVGRFDANTYIAITRAMDNHDIARGRGSLKQVLRQIPVPALCAGISSDVLYPPHEQQALAAAIPGAEYVDISSPFGHDAFLIEFEQLGSAIISFLTRIE